MLRCFDRIARTWSAWTFCLLVFSAGCDKEPPSSVSVQPQPSPKQAPAQDSSSAVETPPVKPPKVRERRPPEPPQPLARPATSEKITGPRILLSEAHRETCRLVQGDVVPDATVTDIDGTNHQLVRLLGEKLTVLVFWSEQSPFAMEQFLRLPIDVLAEFGEEVTVIAVNVGDDMARVRELTGDAAGKIISVVDQDGTLFRQFATSLVPRTYIVDRTGTILWFDLEYSQSSQRELAQALRYFLNKQS